MSFTTRNIEAERDRAVASARRSRIGRSGRASFCKLDDDSWGVRIEVGLEGFGRRLTGQEVEVHKRDGSVKRVRVGQFRFGGNGRVHYYEIQRAA